MNVCTAKNASSKDDHFNRQFFVNGVGTKRVKLVILFIGQNTDVLYPKTDANPVAGSYFEQ